MLTQFMTIASPKDSWQMVKLSTKTIEENEHRLWKTKSLKVTYFGTSFIIKMEPLNDLIMTKRAMFLTNPHPPRSYFYLVI